MPTAKTVNPDLSAQTKAVGEQFVSLVSQAQRATIASVKSFAGFSAPLTEKLPTLPTLVSQVEVKSVVETAFVTFGALLDQQKAFAGELIDALVPAAK